MKDYLVIDLEMCQAKPPKKSRYHLQNEIIQIGAVIMDRKNQVTDHFSIYVKPSYPHYTEIITKLTGITEEMLKDALDLRAALNQFSIWLADRDVTVVSWSDSDYEQLMEEMSQKKIKNHRIQNLFDDWGDLQKAFGDKLQEPNQVSLDRAMKLSVVKQQGRRHDGYYDAFNTACLYGKLRRLWGYHWNLVSISSYYKRVQPLTFRMGSLFTRELMSSLQLADEEPKAEVVVLEDNKEYKTLYWYLCRILYGKEKVTGVQWRELKFHHQILRMDMRDRICHMFQWTGFKIFQADKLQPVS